MSHYMEQYLAEWDKAFAKVNPSQTRSSKREPVRRAAWPTTRAEIDASWDHAFAVVRGQHEARRR
ncbi:hypothetical protein [Cupriavidus sp. AcVe19-6a]|uniref:hypothetical protein n=1 Tax=Cupriavidus sp. AcVe19-6a TaxID=2821358 RepID=UPI001AE4B4AA|nr:hypothetical protein [Cupriavidus sp. AcVe19-6a]MBP0639568.1 hypothetical protein [Cupriavidus sp. AcVe19-6a]